MEFVFIIAAQKQFDSLDLSIRSQILKKLDLMKDDKLFLNNLIPVRGLRCADYRIRVGNYRLLLKVDLNKNESLVVAIGHRRDIYKFD